MNETTTVDQRVATVREFVASVFNGHEPDLAREYMTPEVVWHGNTVGTIAGVDTVVAVLGGFIGALPDIHAEEQDVIASDDLVAVRLVVSATQTGDLLGIPASGRAVTRDQSANRRGSLVMIPLTPMCSSSAICAASSTVQA